LLQKIKKYLLHPAVLLPLAMFLITKAFAYWIAGEGNCWDGFGPDCWVRWDSGLYVRIAEHGHQLFHCGPEYGYPVGAPEWCGTAGWAPLYPWFMRIFHGITGIDLVHSGLILSNIFLLGYLFVCAQILAISGFHIRHWLLLALCAFCPGNIYFHSLFPLSQVSFFLALFFLFLQREKFLYAGIAAYLAVLSYSIGFFLLAVLGIYALLFLFRFRNKFWPYVLQTCIPATAGLLTIFIYDQLVTGHWDALFLIQQKYGHTLHSPTKLFVERWQIMAKEPLGMKTWMEVQNMFIIVYIISMSVVQFRKGFQKPFDFFHGLYLFVLWFLPYSASTNVALYRNAAILGPAHSVAKTLPTWALAILVAIFIGLSYPLGILFIQSIIV
jgi:hypothetical protein